MFYPKKQSDVSFWVKNYAVVGIEFFYIIKIIFIKVLY
jgi:hypothetical protein